MGFNLDMISPIFSVNSCHYQKKDVSFKANINSSRLKFKPEEFFINIESYGKNYEWAEKAKDIADTTVNLIRNKCSFDNIMRYISAGIAKANSDSENKMKREFSGVLRTEREHYKFVDMPPNHDLVTYYGRTQKYGVYHERLDWTQHNPIKNPFEEIELSRPMKTEEGSFISHCHQYKINSGMDLLNQKYGELIGKYNPEKVGEKDLNDINNRIAEIRWILAHITPWLRGSDAISNVFMRSLYKAMGIKSYNLAKNKALDFEAFCTPLDKYKKDFSSYFVRKPKVIE